jgi:metallopeptidase MepB
MMNLPEPTNSKPTLLPHDLLRRLFHELGHAMHNLLSKTKTTRFHGPPKDRDFTEAVSMMFENFLWIPDIMSDISMHYSYLNDGYREAWMAENPGVKQPPARIKGQTVQSIIDARHIGEIGRTLMIIWHSLFDMALHTQATHEDVKNLDLQVLWNKSLVEVTGRKGPEDEEHKWGHGYSGFRAVVAGYDAGYFTYILSRVVSYDLFNEGFLKDPLDPARGAIYRNIVLGPGGSVDPADITRKFLGRDADDAAFKATLGL